MPRTFAAADIGSNTAHLLVAETDGQSVKRVDNVSEWVALGETVAREGKVPKDAADHLAETVIGFRRTAATSGAEAIYIFATEAIRAAANHDQVLEKIREHSKVRVDVISPRREAELSLLGLKMDAPKQGFDLLFEVGGGSAQVGRVKKGELAEEQSLPLGTGRLVADTGLRSPSPPEALEEVRLHVARVLEECTVSGDGVRAVASGGVARGLWRALHPDGEKRLHRTEIDFLEWSTARTPADLIASRFGVKARRAETLLPGSVVYASLMRRFGLEELFVSEYGVREGAILEMNRKRVPSCPL
jgi:exopolyphosphatase / guanosine-5'-triphosphate,3'-diphosphate pyrophosphatase